MLRQNKWYASFPDWTYIYRILLKNEHPALVLHVVTMNEEEGDLCKMMFNRRKTHIYGQGKNIYLFMTIILNCSNKNICFGWRLDSNNK